MPFHVRSLVLALLGTVALAADDSLVHARRAQALLGPDVWSQVIRIENNSRTNRYPRTLHALVFELADVLWFYTDTDGTQSFSIWRNRLADEKSDFGPLLADIEPGFTRWRVMPNEPGEQQGAFPNGCFIESVAAWRARLAEGGETMKPRLLAYYIDTYRGRAGHTVLTYFVQGELEVVDPVGGTTRARRYSAALAGDARALARAVSGRDVAAARLLPLDGLELRVTAYTVATTAGDAAGSARAGRGGRTVR